MSSSLFQRAPVLLHNASFSLENCFNPELNHDKEGCVHAILTLYNTLQAGSR